MKANIRTMICAADEKVSDAQQTRVVKLPARVICSVTVPGWNCHIDIDVDEVGRPSVSGFHRVPITQNSTRDLDETLGGS